MSVHEGSTGSCGTRSLRSLRRRGGVAVLLSAMAALFAASSCSGDADSDGANDGGEDPSGGEDSEAGGPPFGGSSEGGSTMGGGGATGVGGRNSGGTGGATCYVGHACDCPDGTRGYWQCLPFEQCNCEACPLFEADEVEPFEACGGEPFGTWAFTGHDATGARFPDAPQLFGLLDECPTRVLTPELEDTWLIRFGDAGAIDGPGSQQLPAVFSVANSCPKWVCPEAVPGYRCTHDCGVCTCELNVDVFGALTPPWTRKDGSLSFGGGATVAYCVDGDTLTLQDDNRVKYRFERRQAAGTPLPCADREPSECALGRGCQQGACTGDAACEVQRTETTCTNRMGCTWDESACGGEALACALQDYGRVPGCNLYGADTACDGTPTPCEDYPNAAECRTAAGCSFEPQCTGGERSCAEIYASEQLCYVPGGCVQSSEGCTGTIDCADQPEDGCRSELGCQWVASCTGMPPSCDSFGLDECEEHAGCELVGGL